MTLNRGTIFILIHLLMTYNTLVADRYSAWVSAVTVNPVLQTAQVRVKGSDDIYKYSNVPTLECLRLLNTPDISLGRWVNRVLKADDVFCTKSSLESLL